MDMCLIWCEVTTATYKLKNHWLGLKRKRELGSLLLLMSVTEGCKSTEVH